MGPFIVDSWPHSYWWSFWERVVQWHPDSKVDLFNFTLTRGCKETKSDNNKKTFGYQTQGPGRMQKDFWVPNSRPRPDGQNVSGWYGQLRVQKSVLSVFNDVKSPGQSFNALHFLDTIAPSTWYSWIIRSSSLSLCCFLSWVANTQIKVGMGISQTNTDTQ